MHKKEKMLFFSFCETLNLFDWDQECKLTPVSEAKTKWQKPQNFSRNSLNGNWGDISVGCNLSVHQRRWEGGGRVSIPACWKGGEPEELHCRSHGHGGKPGTSSHEQSSELWWPLWSGDVSQVKVRPLSKPHDLFAKTLLKAILKWRRDISATRCFPDLSREEVSLPQISLQRYSTLLKVSLQNCLSSVGHFNFCPLC